MVTHTKYPNENMYVSQKLPVVTSNKGLLSSLRQGVLVKVAFVAIVAAAIALRFYGLAWDDGFPYTPHPDERAILFKVADISPPTLGNLGVLLDADESPWNPRWFPYGSLPLYALKGVQLIVWVLPGDGLPDLRVPGRAMSALADVVTVGLIFFLGSKVYDRRTGLLASALVALSVIHIQLSHFFAVDTLLALFTIAAVFFMYKTAREGRTRDSVLTGLFVGLGLATKVSLAPIYAAFIVAHLMYLFSMNGVADGASTFERRLPATIKALAIGLAVSLVVFFVAEPYAFLDWDRFYSDVTEQSEMVRRIRDYPYTRQYVDTTPYLYHMQQLATWGLGWPLGIVAWGGMLYASLRGMRLRYGVGYLLVGWGLPAAILMFSNSFIGIFLASGIAVAALLATLPIRSENTRMDVLMLSWVVPYFLITGAFQVKFMRYLIPVTPFLVIFGSRMLWALWDRATFKWPSLRPVVALGIALMVGATAFYAVSYTSVYNDTHTAVRASEWLNRNAPENSLVLKEHWEEAIPNLRGHDLEDLPLYNDDSPIKTRLVAERLAEADYIVFFSNRLYGTIPRLPERYPTTTAYYNLLFTEQLGYRLANVQATYPELLGVGFVDDTFGRPDVPEPVALQDFSPSPLTLNLGFADESFSVYDHPKVLIFENNERLDEDTIRLRLEGATLVTSDAAIDEVQGQDIGLLLSSEDAAAQQSGGTWSEIVRPDSWMSRLPVVAWLVVIEGIALLTLPITFMVFRPLADRGYLFSKALGLLLVGLVVWLLASLQWIPFSRGSISLALVLLAVVSLGILAFRRQEILGFVRERWSLLLIAEFIFLVAFLAFVAVRMANPDLWHPFRGGEKPMDFAYLNAVLRSSYMPPYDPWFGGGYINYYYWGQFLTATMIRATSIDPTVAFNLAIPMFFAMTVGGAYTIVYNLAEGTRRRLGLLSGQDDDDGGESAPHPSLLPRGEGLSSHPQWEGIEEGVSPGGIGEFPPHPNLPPEGEGIRTRPLWGRIRGGASPVLAGFGGALFVAVLGNLDGAIQVGHGLKRVLLFGESFGQFDFWRSSRMMPPDPPGLEITEFPFFSFLFADLHAHMMVIPFTILALGVSLAVVLGAAHMTRPGSWGIGAMLRIAVLGVVVGALRLINTWDFPTYLIIGAAAIVLAEYFMHGGWGFVMLVRAGVKSVFMVAVGYVVFLPFLANYETFFSSVESTTNTTVLWQFLAISGLFIFIIGSFFVRETRDFLRRIWSAVFSRYTLLANAVAGDIPEGEAARIQSQINVWWVLGLVGGAVALGFVLTGVFSGTVGSTVPFVLALLVLVLVAGIKWLSSYRADLPYLAFVAVMIGVALMLVLGLDFVRVEGDIDRMNSVFKFYLQVWVMLALASAYLLWRMAYGRRVSLWRLTLAKKAWVGMLAILVLSASIYPIFGTQDRLRDRFNDTVTAVTLDGTAYIKDTKYRDHEGEVDLETDYEGIEWLKQNVQGSPIVLEANTPTYRWGGRVSIYTGLPSVVGWQWHQEQQRWDYRSAVGNRIRDVEHLYETTDSNEALSLLQKYGVKYVYVGQLEKLYYPGPGLDKFEDSMGGSFTRVFQNSDVAIYQVGVGAF